MASRNIKKKQKRRNRLFSAGLISLVILGSMPQLCLSWDRPAIKSPEIENQVYTLCARCDQLVASSSYSQALGLLHQASTLDPTSYSPYVHMRMAECYRLSHQYPQAIQEAQTALKFEPNYCEALYSLSQSYYESEHYDTAAQYMKKLLQVSPDRRWVETGNSFLTQIETYGNIKAALKAIDEGHLGQARDYLNAAARHDPSAVSSCVHSNLAFIMRQTGHPEEAIEEGKKSLQYKADDKGVIYTIAICYQDIGKFSDSIEWLQRYLGVETDSAKRQLANTLISDLKADKGKLNESVNNLPDYLDHMVGANPLHRWSKKSLPIKVHISDGRGVNGFRPKFVSYIPRALDTWCNASGNKLSYKLVPKAADADIDVSWISKPIMLNEGGHNRTKQGVAHLQTADDTVITNVLVEVDTMSGFEPSKPLEESACASVCMHEIGHALGLDHCTNFCDIMYFGASAKQTGLPTKRDKTTIAKLYQNYPVSGLAPKEKPPAPMKFLPPPAFVPPPPPGATNLAPPPMFVPPPIVPESQKLTPPFFKPAPLKSDPPPPLFTPPPVGDASKASAEKHKEKNAKKAPESLPFFTPPPVK